MAGVIADRAEKLRAEKNLKAETDIEEGWKRLRNQEDLLLELEADGHDTKVAARLVELLKSTLIEWERHRALIEDRVAYLEGGVRSTRRSLRSGPPRSPELGAQFEHVLQLLQDALAPVVVLIEELAGLRGRKFRPAEQSAPLVRQFHCRFTCHGPL